MYPQWRAVRTALRKHWPIIVSVHNMLGGWLWRRGRVRQIKKELYLRALLKPSISSAFAIQALSEEERGRIAQFFDDSQIVTIPNALDLAAVDATIAQSAVAAPGGERYVLFVGRIHPQKGLEVLIDAVTHVANLRVIIAGPTADPAYEKGLRAQCARLGLSERVAFIGPVHGPAKWKLLSEAWVFCSPTHTEGMSMAALEAMAARVPVVTTHGSGLTDMDGAGGYLVDVNATEMTGALVQASRWTPEERLMRGARARARVEQKYSWPKVWPLYENLYRSAAAAKPR
jgi:glycosyltransferase involved in cell wall biosynthesis